MDQVTAKKIAIVFSIKLMDHFRLCDSKWVKIAQECCESLGLEHSNNGEDPIPYDFSYIGDVHDFWEDCMWEYYDYLESAGIKPEVSIHEIINVRERYMMTGIDNEAFDDLIREIKDLLRGYYGECLNHFNHLLQI